MALRCFLLVCALSVWLDVQARSQYEQDAGPFSQAVTELAPLVPGKLAEPRQLVNSTLPGAIRWTWSTLGMIGRDLLDSADLTGDGRAEVVLIGTMHWGFYSRSLFVLGDELDRVICFLDDIPEQILDHYIFQGDEDRGLDILIASEEELILLDGKSCRIRQRQSFPGPVVAAGIGDVNGNGIPDVAFSIGGNLFVAPWNDFSSPLERRGFGGSRIIVDSLGRAGGDDIGVVAEVLFVLRGDTLETVAEIAGETMQHVAFGDVTGDGIGNVVLGATWYDGVRVFDLHDDSPVMTHPIFNLSVMRTQDVTGDGIREIVYGEAQWGDAHVLTGDGELLHTLPNPNHGISNVLAVDFDGNGQMDLLWGNRQLFRGNLSSETITWRSPDLRAPFQVASINQDRVLVSSAASNQGYSGGELRVLSASTGQVINVIETGGSYGYRVTAITAGAIETGGGPHFCVAIQHGWTGQSLACHDASSGNAVWNRWPEIGSIHSLMLDDIDGDGQIDLLMLSNSGVARLYNAATGNLKWESEELGTYSQLVSWGFNDVALIDGELWIVLPLGTFRRLDPVNGDILAAIDDSALRHIALVDGTLFGVRAGEGVGKLDPRTLAFQQVIHATADELSLLTASPDGKILLTATGERPDLNAVLLSPAGEFAPWEIGSLISWGEHFTESGDLVIATNLGAMRVRTDRLFVLFRDRFE